MIFISVDLPAPFSPWCAPMCLRSTPSQAKTAVALGHALEPDRRLVTRRRHAAGSARRGGAGDRSWIGHRTRPAVVGGVSATNAFAAISPNFAELTTGDLRRLFEPAFCSSVPSQSNVVQVRLVARQKVIVWPSWPRL
jgi:hypothetical protein